MEYLRTSYGDLIPMPRKVETGSGAERDAWAAAMQAQYPERFIAVPQAIRERARKDGPRVIDAFIADHVKQHPLEPLELPDEADSAPSEPAVAPEGDEMEG